MNSVLVLSFVSTALYIDSKGGKTSWMIKAIAALLAAVILYDISQKVQIGYHSRPQLAEGGIGGRMTLLENKTEPSQAILSVSLPVKATPQQMPYGKTAHNELRLSCPAGNAGSVFVANSSAGCTSGPRYEIASGDQETFKVTEISSLFFIGTAGDTLDIFAEIESYG